MNNQKEEYLTIEEVAEKLKMSTITVYRMARKGQLPAVKFGKVWRISSLKLSELFESKLKAK
ncbi:MAG TPA: helix-turn-helix domain-containing protein [Candidatus Nanoarchaeia archaeon]|nr:helix-turn-helix domain-containing protein [Candidatus Nanoarchaeia archaeon]